MSRPLWFLSAELFATRALSVLLSCFSVCLSVPEYFPASAESSRYFCSNSFPSAPLRSLAFSMPHCFSRLARDCFNPSPLTFRLLIFCSSLPISLDAFCASLGSNPNLPFRDLSALIVLCIPLTLLSSPCCIILFRRASSSALFCFSCMSLDSILTWFPRICTSRFAISNGVGSRRDWFVLSISERS